MKQSPQETHSMLQSVRELLCSRFFPGAIPLLLAEESDVQTLRRLRPLVAIGFQPEECTRIPNAVLDCPNRGWLILLEIAECHGVIDSGSRQNLLSSYASVKARDIVLVTAFADRAEFARHQAVIASGTCAWIAQEPDHVVVFGGRCLVGPKPVITSAAGVPFRSDPEDSKRRHGALNRLASHRKAAARDVDPAGYDSHGASRSTQPHGYSRSLGDP